MTDRRSGWVALAGTAIRGLLLATGIGVFIVGIVVVLVPGTGDLIPIEAAIAVLGSDYVVVAVLGVLAVGLLTLVVAARQVRGVDEATPPAVEGVQSATYPGRSLDRPDTTFLDRWAGDPSETDRRDRLRQAAVHATMRAEGIPRGVAERRVSDGDWTDDPVVARYLGEPAGAERGAGRRSRNDGSGRTDRTDGGRGSGSIAGSNDRAVRRTVDAIVRLSDGDRGSRRGKEGGDPDLAEGTRSGGVEAAR